jgi:hypothetical protein
LTWGSYERNAIRICDVGMRGGLSSEGRPIAAHSAVPSGLGSNPFRPPALKRALKRWAILMHPCGMKEQIAFQPVSRASLPLYRPFNGLFF